MKSETSGSKGLSADSSSRGSSEERAELSGTSGLSEAEASARMIADGPNELPSEKRRGVLRIAFEVVREPMFLLLIAAATIYFVFGDVQEALTLLGAVVVVLAITIVQEGRTEKSIAALRDLSSPRAQVIRDGVVRTVPGRELVCGDVVKIAEGDRVPADLLLRRGTALAVDESLLSGESVPATKHAEAKATTLGAVGESSAALWSGTLVVGGRGVAEVMATGARSELGRIGASLVSVEKERTPLQREVDLVVKRMAVFGLAASAVVVIATGLTGTDWLHAILAGITLAMSLLPEELPVVLTVFLALGAWRIAKSRVLTRRVTSVETLGAVHVLCTDKTGTLTENRMTIQELRTAALEHVVDDDELPEEVHALVEMGILASPRDPFDPMEKAFHALGQKRLGGTEHLHPSWEAVREYPLTAELLAVTYAWRPTEGADGSTGSAGSAADGSTDAGLVVATKGAPEAIFELCHLDDEVARVWRERVDSMAARGLRVLGVARSRGTLMEEPSHPHELDLDLVGLVGLADPLRGDVAEAIATCRSAGIRVLMITGDHALTARAIATEAGLADGEVMTGPEIEAMDDEALAKRLATATVIARAVPAHKLRIVRALRASGAIVGMTGDGVNDAPALKAADIGIAMGKRGTDVAREAAALVLVEDDFGSIVDAVRIGRRIYDNLRKAVGYILAVHIPIAGVALVPALLGWGPLLFPAHVVFLELIIDPTCSVVFEMEPAEEGVMKRPPRGRDEHLFEWRRILFSAAHGITVLLGALAMLWWHADASLELRRTLAFVVLVAGNLTIVVASRSTDRPFWTSFRRRNRALWAMAIGVPAVLAVVLFVGPVRALFALDVATWPQLGAALLVAVVPVLLLDVGKLFSRR
jgi:Ca2+-transporting ATPase